MPKGFMPPGGGNMQNLMRQAQLMQQGIARVQAELEDREVSASSGGGMVTAAVTGKKQLKSLLIKPEAVDPDDVEMLQDLVLAAVNEAMAKADALAAEEMAKVTGGMGMPGLF